MPEQNRLKANRMFCEVCRHRYGNMLIGTTTILIRQAIDHTFPRRLIQSMGMNEHAQQNLVSVCGTCHGRKLSVEQAIFGADIYGFIRGLVGINWNMERVLEAADFYGFGAICRKFIVAPGSLH